MLQHFDNGRHRGVPALRVVALATLVVAADRRVAAASGAATRGEAAGHDRLEGLHGAVRPRRTLRPGARGPRLRRHRQAQPRLDGDHRRGRAPGRHRRLPGVHRDDVARTSASCATGRPPLREALRRRPDSATGKRGLRLLQPGTFNDGNAIACTIEFTTQNRVRKISDLRRVMAKTRYATIAEQLTRAERRAVDQAALRLHASATSRRTTSAPVQGRRGRRRRLRLRVRHRPADRQPEARRAAGTTSASGHSTTSRRSCARAGPSAGSRVVSKVLARVNTQARRPDDDRAERAGRHREGGSGGRRGGVRRATGFLK